MKRKGGCHLKNSDKENQALCVGLNQLQKTKEKAKRRISSVLDWPSDRSSVIGVLAAVIVMVMVWSRVYNATLFGILGIIILASFFAIVWVWMKKYAGLDMQEKIARSFKLVGYIFWINASWFLCGETAKMHLKAFEGQSPPSPIEIMVFLVLGWIFVLIGEYKSMRLKRS